MPIDDQGNLVDQTPDSTQSNDISSHAPPLYGEHILDQLYADIDHSGFMTPGPSGMNTPFYSQSRSGSSENITSLDGVASNAVPPAALSSRLQNLNLNANSRNSSFLRRAGNGSGGNTPSYFPEEGNLNHSHASAPNLAGHSRPQSGYFDQQPHNHSAPRSGGPTPHRTSEEELNGISGLTSGQHSPEHIDYTDLGDLSKVPSYTTAVRTPARGMSYSAALPNYEAAVSAPPSPTRDHATPATTPGLEMIGEHRAMTPLGGRATSLVAPREPPQAHITAGGGDGHRRLHLMQARGRAH